MFSIDEIEDFSDVMPDGEYNVVIVDGEIRPSSSNPDNHTIDITCQVQDERAGDFNGTQVHKYFSPKHTNVRWMKKSLSELRNFMGALEVHSFRDPCELVGKKFVAKVETKDDFTTVQDFRKYVGQVPSAVSPHATSGVPF